MANTLYRKLPVTGEWMNQANPGGPNFFIVNLSAADNLWYPYFSYDGGVTWLQFPGNGQATRALAQAQLDNYVGNLNAGTA